MRPLTDQDEWLHPEAVHDEVVIEVDEPGAGLMLRVSLLVTPAGRTVHLVASIDGLRARHDAEAAGPPSTNWDRMRLGPVEWRMVEPLQRWDLSVDDREAGLMAYLTFSGSAAPSSIVDGYEQVGVVSGQLQLAERRVTLTNAPGRRTHTWR
ncbi:MAG: hypothetical protein AVDCRST_MAG76-1658 [uncultured Acidimicrobiales bacterium]|uniref:Uncharacterized protein n=1 Tax=uncultured Acidimicrobiales bacterium TaxID=310071 RepID=A0A6J4I254_9ACTN|nr:MAG: hypothetical protein AVDCRST_MAG76-1658 [uncultured Acidimicrobiales bacterium]